MVMESMPGELAQILLNVGSKQTLKAVARAEAVTALGLVGDSHYKQDSDRQLLVIEEETLHQVNVDVGALRENLVTRGIEVQKLPTGTRLQLGDVVIELTKPCAPCSMLETVRPGLMKEIDGRRGTYARVVTGGTLRVGDPITETQACRP